MALYWLYLIIQPFIMKKLLFAIIITITTIVSNAQVLVADVSNGPHSSKPSEKFVFKNKLIFIAYSNAYYGYEYFIYNDTITSVFNDAPGNNGAGGGVTTNTMAEINGKLYFRGYYNNAGVELWMWDGINPPTLVKDIYPGSDHSFPANIISSNNKLYFVASTGYHSEEVWMHDPATLVTRKLSNIDPTGAIARAPMHLTAFNNKIYFTATNTTAISMYVYDPVADTVGIAPYFDANNGGVEPTDLTVCYDKIYFTSRTSWFGTELYSYDGKSAPVRLTDINPGAGNSLQSAGNLYGSTPRIIGYKGAVYFTAQSSSVSGYQLYKYDTAKHSTGAMFVYKINTRTSPVPEFIEFNGKLYFSGDDSVHGSELWMYDGINNPSMVADINKGADYSYPIMFKAYNNNLYFTATTPATGYELYKLGTGNTNVENVGIVNDIQVYPVPVSNTLHFKMQLKKNCAFVIALCDATGREVYNSGTLQYTSGSSTIPVNVSHLAGGTYQYRISTIDGIMLTAGKVVKP